MKNSTLETDLDETSLNIDFGYILIFLWAAIVIFGFAKMLKVACDKSDNYFGAIDQNKNLDIGVYIREHRKQIRRLRNHEVVPPDYPSWPENVVLPYRPWDHENQVPIY